MTVKSVLNSSACVCTILNNMPVLVTGIHMGNVGNSEIKPKNRCGVGSESYKFILVSEDFVHGETQFAALIVP